MQMLSQGKEMQLRILNIMAFDRQSRDLMLFLFRDLDKCGVFRIAMRSSKVKSIISSARGSLANTFKSYQSLHRAAHQRLLTGEAVEREAAEQIDADRIREDCEEEVEAGEGK